MGDIVRVDKDTEFPSDLLFLSAQGDKDIVYVDTMNLDGETNLKEKYVFSKKFTDLLMTHFHGEVICDQPNESLDEWDANVNFRLLTGA